MGDLTEAPLATLPALRSGTGLWDPSVPREHVAEAGVGRAL